MIGTIGLIWMILGWVSTIILMYVTLNRGFKIEQLEEDLLKSHGYVQLEEHGFIKEGRYIVRYIKGRWVFVVRNPHANICKLGKTIDLGSLKLIDSYIKEQEG